MNALMRIRKGLEGAFALAPPKSNLVPPPTVDPQAKRRVERLSQELAKAQERAADADSKRKEADVRADAEALRANRKDAEMRDYMRVVGGSTKEVNIDQLVTVDGRARKLQPWQFTALVEQLRGNRLMEPVIVRQIETDRFEIVSGHHRVLALEAIGKRIVPIVVLDLGDAEADRMAFFDNLHSSSLSDFEKHLGLKDERERHEPPLSQLEVAKKAGLDPKYVSKLCVFEGLPSAAYEALKSAPHVLGITAASQLVKSVKEGRGDRVIEAIGLLVEGRLTQSQAIAHARKDSERKSRPTVKTQIRVGLGRDQFCSYVTTGATIRIDFKKEARCLAVQEQLEAFLREIAKTHHGTQSQLATP